MVMSWCNIFLILRGNLCEVACPRACSWSGLRRIRCRTQKTLAEKRLHYCTARCVYPRLAPIRIANVYKLQLHTLQAALVCSGTVELNKRPRCSINPVATTTAAVGKQSRLKFIIQNAFLCVFMHKYNDWWPKWVMCMIVPAS